MVFGHPILPWHKCGPRPSSTLPMGVTMGLFEIMNLFFCSNMEYFDPKVQDFAEKIGQKGQKPTPEVADGDHGGLGRVQKVQNGLEDG